MNVFNMACIRRILGITQRYKLCNNDIKEYHHLQKEVNYRIWQWCLRYFSHVMGMNDIRYPKIALLGRMHRIRQKGRSKMLDRQHKGRLWNFGYNNNKHLGQPRIGKTGEPP